MCDKLFVSVRTYVLFVDRADIAVRSFQWSYPCSVSTHDEGEAIARFYRERNKEGVRLTRSPHGRLEFLRTQELVRRCLPPAPARVLAVGGGTGIHARWLAADGYQVHLVDPVDVHVAEAQHDGSFTASVGDARQLTETDGSMDATLLFGPLYHLLTREDRVRALAEAKRVTKPGGLVLAAVISRHSAMYDFGTLDQLTHEAIAGLERQLTTGRHLDNPTNFTHAYFHRADEFEHEMIAAGLHDVRLFGIEGPATPALDAAAPEMVAALLPNAIKVAQLLESDRDVIATSPHLLGIGRV